MKRKILIKILEQCLITHRYKLSKISNKLEKITPHKYKGYSQNTIAKIDKLDKEFTFESGKIEAIDELIVWISLYNE